MPLRPPPGWRPLVDAHTEQHRRRVVLGVTSVIALLGITLATLTFSAGMLAWISTPDGYSFWDTCWVNDGSEEADGEPIVSVSCSEPHDYVSGEEVDDPDDCPADSEGYVDEGYAIYCLELPHESAGQKQDDGLQGMRG
ncbi:hypothetical protein [Kineosporia babensis]|uniref:Uncharacterized protein n=1 Tax=Kineosporia babensis TaxID=499548 RepID=A0A9X1SXR7_9ACTN|nr:hypothetical protein [Kineosporia babensis]MCD5316512.1 hypothetical protein [Kineosporia babensis]